MEKLYYRISERIVWLNRLQNQSLGVKLFVLLIREIQPDLLLANLRILFLSKKSWVLVISNRLDEKSAEIK